MMDIGRISGVLENTGKVRVAVFGDFCLDKYLYSDPGRDEPSVETGLPAWQIHAKRQFPGAGGTVTGNLRSLGAQVTCIGLMGDDGEGYELRKALQAIGADTEKMVQSEELCTNTYTKPMRLRPEGGWEEANRLDLRNFTSPSRALQQRLLENLESCLHDVNAVILLDQFTQRNTGVLTDDVRQEVGRLAQAHPEVIFYADSRAFIREFRHVIIKCNNFELMGPGVDSTDPEALGSRARELQQTLGKPVFVTRGSQGMLVAERGRVTAVPAFTVTGPVDICGAGDASSAGIVLGLSLGLSAEEAALLGCCVSSITIEQIGVTGTATVQQVRNRLAGRIKE